MPRKKLSPEDKEFLKILRRKLKEPYVPDPEYAEIEARIAKEKKELEEALSGAELVFEDEDNFYDADK